MVDIKQHKVIIINKIIELRGVKVMLDRDLAELYGVILSHGLSCARNLQQYCGEERANQNVGADFKSAPTTHSWPPDFQNGGHGFTQRTAPCAKSATALRLHKSWVRCKNYMPRDLSDNYFFDLTLRCFLDGNLSCIFSISIASFLTSSVKLSRSV